MKAASNQLVSRFLLAGLCSMVLTACDPFEKQRAEQAEKTRIECLDKICTGDKPPPRPPGQVVFKLNGQWFTGPNEYGSPSLGAIAFYWPSKAAHGDPDAVKQAPEVVFNPNGSVSNFSDIAIELFLRHHDGVTYGPNRIDLLEQARVEGRLVSKTTIRPGLEAWRIKEEGGLDPGIWYVATNFVAQAPNAAVLWCRDSNPKFDRCTTAARWAPGIAWDTRFRAKHAQDWPEIFQEINRVLSLLKGA